jgi:type IV pilus assembly protein PilE
MLWRLNRVALVYLKNKSPGMTLVELMVVLAIIGILALVVYPTLQGHILKSRRNDGATQLLRIKIQQESYRLTHPSYATNTQLSLPVSDYYDFSVVNTSASTYTLVALAKGSQQADSACQTFAIDQSMHKTPAYCW